MALDDMALVGGRVFTGLADLTSDITALDSRGFWVVVLPYSGPPICARFRSVSRDCPSRPGGRPALGPFSSSIDRDGFCSRVAVIRQAIAAGDVYQVNLCRRLSTPWPATADIGDLGELLARQHPSSHSAVVRLPSVGMHIASASPERFLRREGSLIESRPIKGTANRPEGLSPKDRAENVMIVDLVRNDLGRVCEYGSVTVAGLCELERQPGLVHLVSTVRGRLRQGVGWAELLGATFPPGSVTGAPKLAAVAMIDRLEPGRRGVYCGAIGWVDADAGRGDLNVAIRTFWVEEGRLCFGTGGGITWYSSPEDEWEETELKADRLLQVVEGRGPGSPAGDEALIGNLAHG